jgi:hypothetical protein
MVTVTLEGLTLTPERDAYNNPVWKLPAIVRLSRQDNTLSLQEHAGTLSNEDVHADVSHIYGGFVFGLSIQRKTKAGKRFGDTERYAIDCRSLLEQVIGLNLELREVPRLPPPQKVENAKAKPRANPTSKGRTKPGR